MKILIIDDSKTEAQALSSVLEARDHQVLVATSGEQGVVLAANEQPDVVLMDVVMPGLNGFQATRQIKRSPDTRHIPVIIISSKGQDIDIIWGERQGAATYLVKPVNQQQLLAAIAAATAAAATDNHVIPPTQ
ncbi:MAG: response regulator [Pseudomonadales bacterium]